MEAYEKDWKRPPFELTQDDTYFYGRGTIDNKFGVAQLTSTFIRLKKEGFIPTRDLFLIFSGDEESGMTTTRMLAYERPELAQAQLALNSDAGGGSHLPHPDGREDLRQLRADGAQPRRAQPAAREDNAIYELADALKRIQA